MFCNTAPPAVSAPGAPRRIKILLIEQELLPINKVDVVACGQKAFMHYDPPSRTNAMLSRPKPKQG